MRQIDCDGYHVLWTRPKTLTTGNITFTETELACWLVGINRFKAKVGRIAILTDSIGAEYLKEVGIDKMYDAGVHVVLDDFLDIRSDVFWASAKLKAHQLVKLGAIYFDMDAIVWKKPDFKDDLIALNYEFSQSVFYQKNADHFSHFGFYTRNWQVHPISSALLSFNDHKLKTFYTLSALTFMEAYSYRTLNMDTSKIMNSENAMVFAEQQLLGMCTDSFESSVRTLAVLDEFHAALKPNPYVSHIWSHKHFYLQNPIANANFIQSCRENYLNSDLGQFDRIVALGARNANSLVIHSGDDLIQIEDIVGEIQVLDPVLWTEFKMTGPGCITRSCRFRVPEGSSYKLADKNAKQADAIRPPTPQPVTIPTAPTTA